MRATRTPSFLWNSFRRVCFGGVFGVLVFSSSGVGALLFVSQPATCLCQALAGLLRVLQRCRKYYLQFPGEAVLCLESRIYYIMSTQSGLLLLSLPLLHVLAGTVVESISCVLSLQRFLLCRNHTLGWGPR